MTGLLGQGSVGEAITRSQTMIEAYPLQEHCWWLRMIALYRVQTTIGREELFRSSAAEALDGPSASTLLLQASGDTVSAADAFALIRRVGGNPLLLTEYARLPPDERREGRIPLAARGLLERL